MNNSLLRQDRTLMFKSKVKTFSLVMMYSITNKNLVTENWLFYYLEVGVMYVNAHMNLHADSKQVLFEPMILKHS